MTSFVASLNVRDFVVAAWLFALAVWLLGSMRVKRTRHAQPSADRLVQLVLVCAAFVFLFQSRYPFAWLKLHPFPGSPAVAAVGCLLLIAGIAFAIFARASLGKNWSSNVALKAGHKLICEGPYAIVRHPIYTGFLLAILGSAIALNEVHALLAFPLALLGWKLKSRVEERFMTQEFGSEYIQYRHRVKAIVPFVW